MNKKQKMIVGSWGLTLLSLILFFILNNFTQSVLFLILSLALSTFTSVLTIKTYKTPISITSIIPVAILAIMAISIVLPASTDDEKGNIKKDTVYVTWNPNCEYCKISHSAMNYAVNTYKLKHPTQKIQVVEIDDEKDELTPLAKGLDHAQEHFGSVTRLRGENNVVDERPYTMQDENGTPLAQSPDYIYELIKRQHEQ